MAIIALCVFMLSGHTVAAEDPPGTQPTAAALGQVTELSTHSVMAAAGAPGMDVGCPVCPDSGTSLTSRCRPTATLMPVMPVTAPIVTTGRIPPCPRSLALCPDRVPPSARPVDLCVSRT